MNRKLSCAVLGALVLLASACGGGDPPASEGGGDEAPVELPQGSEIIDVPVTRPTDPQPVNPKDLPATARAVNQMPALNADEKLCANYAIKTTLDADGSIAQTNGKMAGVLGNAVVACTTPERLATIVTAGIGADDGNKLSAEQRACLEQHISGDTAGTGRFLGALLTLNVTQVLDASKAYNEACQVQLGA